MNDTDFKAYPLKDIGHIKADNQDGKIIALKELIGTKYVLFFYPKDNTPGCTIESCAFRDAYADFKALGIEVFGISRDSMKKHQNFIKKHDLPYDLIADTDDVYCNAFDVLKEKSMFGKKYIGIDRSTFLIDAQGHVQQEWRKVKIIGHVKEVLEAASEL